MKHRKSQSKTSKQARTHIVAVMILGVCLAIVLQARMAQTNVVKPVTPAIPHVEKEITWAEMSEILREIVANHPHTTIRDNMYTLIMNGQLRLSFANVNGEANFFLSEQGEVQYVPTLNIKPSFILNVRRNQASWVRAQLVIFHEYVHYLQWQNDIYPEDTFVFTKVHDSRLKDSCKKKWYAEVSAYHEECDFAHDSGLIDRIDPRSGVAHLCRATLESFDSTLRDNLIRGDPSSVDCTGIWASL